MTNIQELYDICSRENITIDFIDCPKCGAISLFGAGGCAIGIDSQTPARLLKERTAHEIGHCVKGAFYNRYATADNISQHEYRADKWAIENLIPKSELIKAIKKNLDSIYLLAQHFDVSEDFMIKACEVIMGLFWVEKYRRGRCESLAVGFSIAFLRSILQECRSY